jgi:hypothetical protein
MTARPNTATSRSHRKTDSAAVVELCNLLGAIVKEIYDQDYVRYFFKTNRFFKF